MLKNSLLQIACLSEDFLNNIALDSVKLDHSAQHLSASLILIIDKFDFIQST
jgi:hypothetical protein